MQKPLSENYLPLLILILSVKFFFVALFIFYSGIGLSPDEAQYWTWSQSLSWGYYSKPPGIAWLIAFGTSIFGNTEWGVRFSAEIIGVVLPLAVYGLTITCKGKKETAFWAALVMALTPLGFASSFFATTDGPMVLFWTLASLCFLKGFVTESAPHYLLLGGIIACGALFKWPIYLFWLIVVAALAFYPFLRQWQIFWGFIISLLGLFPSFIWNSTHNWVTFRHVFSTVKGAPTENSTANPNFWDFVGAQVGLTSPIIFFLLLFSIFYLVKHFQKIPSQYRYGAYICFFSLGVLALVALIKKIQGNWGVFAYPTGFVFLAWVIIERYPSGKKWLKFGLCLSVILIMLLLSITRLQENGIPIPYKFNPFRHTVGWNHLAPVLTEAGYDPTSHFLFSDKYQTTSILSFYSPKQKRAYFLNLLGIRNNQFSFWPSLQDEQVGSTGFFVVIENVPYLTQNQQKIETDYLKLLKTYFKEVDYIGIKPLFKVGDRLGKGAFIFKCQEYNGKIPPDSPLY